MRTTLLAIALSFAGTPARSPKAAAAAARDPRAPSRPSRPARTGFQKIDGYMPLYWDDKTGTLWMEIGKFDTEML